MFVAGLGRQTSNKAELGIFRVSAPMEQLGIDIIGDGTFHKTKGGFTYILSVIDHFTKWAVAVPMKDRTTETVAQAVLDHSVTMFEVPMRIHSDRGLYSSLSSFMPSADYCESTKPKQLHTDLSQMGQQSGSIGL